MSTEMQTSVMQDIHEMAVAEFGRMAGSLCEDGMLQPIAFPGGSYALVIAPAQVDAIAIRQPVGFPDLRHAGLAELLLREHAQWVFGRLQMIGDALYVESSLLVPQLSPEALRRVVLSVHHTACETEKVLAQTGALLVADDEEGE